MSYANILAIHLKGWQKSKYLNLYFRKSGSNVLNLGISFNFKSNWLQNSKSDANAQKPEQHTYFFLYMYKSV